MRSTNPTEASAAPISFVNTDDQGSGDPRKINKYLTHSITQVTKNSAKVINLTKR